MPPHLPRVEPGVTLAYSSWRASDLDTRPPGERDHARSRIRAAAQKGHALRLHLHPDHAPSPPVREAYTEVVAFHDPDDGRPRQGIRTVRPGGEELALYPDQGLALTAYRDLTHRSVT